MAAVGGAGGDGVDPGGDGDQLRLLGVLLRAQVVFRRVPGGAQLPGHRLRPRQGAGLVVGAGAAAHAPPRRPAPLRLHGPRRLRRAVLLPRLPPHRPLLPGAYSIPHFILLRNCLLKLFCCCIIIFIICMSWRRFFHTCVHTRDDDFFSWIHVVNQNTTSIFFPGFGARYWTPRKDRLRQLIDAFPS
jgi:hypothetical protein